MSAPVVWFEVMGQDADKLRGFYSEMFSWEFDVQAPADYGLVDQQGDGICGGVGRDMGTGTGWTTFYVRVADIDGAIAQAEKLGGKTLMPRQKLPSGDTVAVVTDPEGHPVGLVSCPKDTSSAS